MGRGWRNWFRLSGQTFGRRQQPVDGTANSFNKDELDKELIKLEQEVELLKKKLASLEK
jgi:transposase-like protein